MAEIGKIVYDLPMKFTPKTTLFIVAGLALFLTACTKQEEASAATIALADCLKEKGVKFYGAFWCPHCADQKEMFANAVGKLPYIECSTADSKGQTPTCQKAGIKSYPTWEFADGTRREAVLQKEDLATQANCPYKEE